MSDGRTLYEYTFALVAGRRSRIAGDMSYV